MLQHSTLQIENVKKNGKNVSVKETLLIDLSKTFDCLDRILLTAKLNAYSFKLPALSLIHDYLSNRKQRIKIENNYIT